MLRIDKDGKKLVRLTESNLAETDHWERDLQSMICAAPDAFCKEIGESLLLLGEEVQPSTAVPDRIDILALDESGNAVIIELKRGTHKLQLLQAVSYVGMVSKWGADDFVKALARSYHDQPLDNARTAIEAHIEAYAGPDFSSINQEQRILLIAEDFDPALLIATEWLHERFGVDIRCYRLQLSRENETDYLTCTCVYPPIEIATLTRRSSGKSGQSLTPLISWDDVLLSIGNPTLKEFAQTALKRENNEELRLQYREIIYRIYGKRRFWLGIRSKFAYVRQGGRFDDDIAFWKARLPEANVKPVNQNRALRFHLTTPNDFAAFSKAISNELANKEFSESIDLDQTPNDEQE